MMRAMTQFRIFDIPLSRLSGEKELREKLSEYISGEQARVVFTPNPEILMQAKAHSAYADVLRCADLRVPDGSGVQLIGRLKGSGLLFRYPGVDIGRMLLDIAYQKRLRVMLLGGRNGSAISAAERLTKPHSDFQIYAAGDNAEVSESGDVPDPKEEQRIRDAILQIKPAVLLVGLGAPKQEQWIIRHKDAFPSVRIFVGVGGSFDIWSGRLRRAPRLMRLAGLEWFWRLLLEPARLPRILTAVVRFPVVALLDKRTGKIETEHEA